MWICDSFVAKFVGLALYSWVTFGAVCGSSKSASVMGPSWIPSLYSCSSNADAKPVPPVDAFDACCLLDSAISFLRVERLRLDWATREVKLIPPMISGAGEDVARAVSGTCISCSKPGSIALSSASSIPALLPATDERRVDGWVLDLFVASSISMMFAVG